MGLMYCTEIICSLVFFFSPFLYKCKKKKRLNIISETYYVANGSMAATQKSFCCFWSVCLDTLKLFFLI